MKVYLIKASAKGPFKAYKKDMGAPSQNIFSAAATTPKHIEVELCDETIDMKPNFKINADIVAIFYHTPDAIHTYELADEYKRRGYTVILGGLHPSFLPNEAIEHADAVMIGEVEGIWEEMLADYENGELKYFYKRSTYFDLADLNPYPTNLIPVSKYKHFWSVVVTRGCPHRCEFCTIPQFFQDRFRMRPIENIIAEIKALPKGTWVELHSDNLTGSRKYALELFNALKPLKVNWVGETTIKLADDEELLKAAADSGCKGLLIGIETPSKEALANSGKAFVDPDDIAGKIKKFHDAGIEITSSMIFGFDSHTADIFQESIDFCKNIKIKDVQAVVLIPFPGTPLFDKLEAEGRILTRDWSKYNGFDIPFQPKNMTVEELSKGNTNFWYKKPTKSMWKFF